jgi:hypothetical protein
MALCRQRDSAGALDVNGAICLCGRFGQDANEVDDRIRSRHCGADSNLVKYIGLDELWWLARHSRPLNTTGVAYGQTHRCATSDKRRHEMAADEPGPAEHRDRAGHDSFPCPEIARTMHHGPRSVFFKRHQYYRSEKFSSTNTWK